ncbi:MAG: hypothetical protein WD995_14260 [Gemmatimonadota bacterium]
MTWTLEEQISAELDTLWQAALFLAGGRREEAEWLLEDTVSAASDDLVVTLQVADGTDKLERFMVRRFFQGAVRMSLAPGTVTHDDSAEAPEAEVAALLRDAGRVPDRPRAALWLIVIRRRSYDEGASILGIERDELRDLLEYREVLMADVIRNAADIVTEMLAPGASSPGSAS